VKKKVKTVPSFVLKNMGLISTRAFKARKRLETRVLQRALSKYQIGCAYSPAYHSGAFQRLEDALRDMEKQQSVKEWGR